MLDQIEAALGGSFALDQDDELVLDIDGRTVDLHTVAVDLYYRHGWKQRHIALALDRSSQTIYRWISYTAAEKDRAACHAYKNRHREQLRANDREYRQRVKVPCPACASPMSPDAILCADCRHATAEVRASIIIGCYAEGWTLNEIAGVLDTNANSMNATLNRLRKQGRIGYRYLVDERGLRLPGRA